MPNHKTRVLFWADDFSPRAGGAELWGRRYVTAMQRRGYEIEVLAVDRAGGNSSADLEGDSLANGFLVHQIFAGDAMRSADPQAFQACLARAIAVREKFQPHLLHLSTGFSAPSLTLFLLASVSARDATQRPGTIGTLHCIWPEKFVHPGCLLERTLRRVDQLASGSEDTRRWATNHWPELSGRFTVIPQALPLSGFFNALSVSETASQTIAFVGRLSREKGPDLALRAFGLLRHSFPELRMIVAGDGQERASLLALASELGVSQFVTFPGWLDEDDVRALMRSSSLVLVPSRQESFGLVALEAAREGRPVVATAVGGIPEVCCDGETAILCAPDDPNALYAAASRLLSDPLLAEQMGRAARAHFLRFTTWEAHLDAYEELIAHVLTARSHKTWTATEQEAS